MACSFRDQVSTDASRPTGFTGPADPVRVSSDCWTAILAHRQSRHHGRRQEIAADSRKSVEVINARPFVDDHERYHLSRTVSRDALG
jgi:hypothetical protein